MSYFPVMVQKMDPDTEEWTNHLQLHALRVNKASRGSDGESFGGGRERYSPRLTFDVAWCKKLEALRYDTQNYRLIYQGQPFNIVDYDDYMETRGTVRLTGEAYG